MRVAPALPLLLMTAPCLAQIATGSVGPVGGPASQINNPVSMVYEHKQSQTLADGTHISTVMHEYFYRDGVGRTRLEHNSVIPGMRDGKQIHTVNVHDPVTHTITTWQTGGPEGGVHSFQRIDQTPARPMNVSPALRTVPSANQAQIQEPSPSPAQQLRPNFTTEHLGRQEVQGVPCEGLRTTVVYPTGFLGNDRPIVTVTERCESREFGRMLRDLAIDPRTGDRSTILQSIQRGEPDPSLFLPPPGYVDSKILNR